MEKGRYVKTKKRYVKTKGEKTRYTQTKMKTRYALDKKELQATRRRRHGMPIDKVDKVARNCVKGVLKNNFQD